MVSSRQQLDLVFAALAEPTRRKLLRKLRRGDFTVTQLAAPYPLSLPAISKHLKVLERAGMIRRRREGSHHIIQLRTLPLTRASRWLEQFTLGSWTQQLAPKQAENLIYRGLEQLRDSLESVAASG